MWFLVVLVVSFAAVVAGGPAASAESPAPTTAPHSSFSATPSFPPLDDVLVPPRGGVRALASVVGGNATRGPGTYDVVVVGIDTQDGPSPATAENSGPIVAAADSYWNETTAGRYRLDYRTIVGVSTPTALCTLPAADTLVNSAVQVATNGLTPRPNHAGVLVVSVMPQPTTCDFPGGMGWLGVGSQLIGGLAWSQQQSASLVLAHESGHNFGLLHANNLECGDGVWPFPLAQSPSWPCDRSEYGDITSVMGNGTAAAGKLNAAHLKTLGLLSAAQSVDVGADSGDVDLVPLYGDGSGPRAATIAVGGATPATMMVEYRPDLGGSGVTLRQVDSAATWLYGISWRGFSDPNSRQGMTVGTTVDLSDGTVVTVVSTGSTARVHVERPGASVPPQKWGSLAVTNIVDGVPGTIAPTDPVCVREVNSGISVTCIKAGAGTRAVTRLPAGNYRIEDTSATFRDGVDHAGQTAAVTAGGTASASLSSHRLQGAITGDGAPVGGAVVEVFGEPGTTIGQSSGPRDQLLSATTDSSGHFQIPGQFYPGETLKLRVTPPLPWVAQWAGGPDRATARVITIAAGASNRADVDLVRAGSILGRITYAGVPPRSATAFALDAAGNRSTATAAADGTFRMDGLRPGNYRVTATGVAQNGTSFSATYVSPAGSATLVLESGAVVRADMAFTFFPPKAPTRLVATAGDGSASVAFVSPVDTGGAPLTNLEVSTDNGATWAARTPASVASPVVVGGLTNGTTYQVRLRAVNVAGPGGASVAVSVTPRTFPWAPTGGGASFPSPRQATLTWGAPGFDGGAAVTGYRVAISAPNSSTVFGDWVAANAPAHTWMGLVPGARYTARIVAVNAAGESDPLYAPFRQATVASAVRAARVAAWPRPGAATIVWAAPASQGDTPVQRYLVRLSAPNSTARFGAWMPNPSQARVLAGLRKGATYRVQIVAVNSQGNSGAAGLTFRQAR